MANPFDDPDFGKDINPFDDPNFGKTNKPEKRTKTSWQEDAAASLGNVAKSFVGASGAMAQALPLDRIGNALGKDYLSKRVELQEQKWKDKITDWSNLDTGGVPTVQKDPGIAGMVAQGAAPMAATIALGLPSVVLQTTGQARNEYTKLRRQGVDHDTALRMAGFEAFTTAITTALPMMGGDSTTKLEVAKTIAKAAGINVSQEWLVKRLEKLHMENSGYKDIAKDYDFTLDQAAASAITGGAGAGVGAALSANRNNKVRKTLAREKTLADEKAARLPDNPKVQEESAADKTRRQAEKFAETKQVINKGENYDLLEGDGGYSSRDQRIANNRSRRERIVEEGRAKQADERALARAEAEFRDRQGDLFGQGPEQLAPAPRTGFFDVLDQNHREMLVPDHPLALPYDPNVSAAVHTPIPLAGPQGRGTPLDPTVPTPSGQPTMEAPLQHPLPVPKVPNPKVGPSDLAEPLQRLWNEDNSPPPPPKPLMAEDQIDLPLPIKMPPPKEDLFTPASEPVIEGQNKGYSLQKGKDADGKTAWYVIDENDKIVSQHSIKQQAEQIVKDSTESSRPPTVLDSPIRRKQGGAINFGALFPKKAKKKEVDVEALRKAQYLKNIPGWNIIDSFLIPKDLDTGITAALDQQDIPTSATKSQLAAGIHFKAASTGNPLLGFFQDRLRESNSAARADVKRVGTPMGASFSSLSTQERHDATAALVKQSLQRRNYTPEELSAAGYSPNTIKYMKEVRTAMDTGWGDWNTMRKSGDQVKYLEGYLPSRFKGDYVSLVTRNGEIVDVLSTSSLKEMNDAQSWAKSTYGNDITISKTNRKAVGDYGNGEFVSALNQIIKIVGDDPALAHLKEALGKQGYEDAKSMYQFDNHELAKKGVRSFDGNKGWKSTEENTKALYDSLVDYIDELYVTSHRYGVMEDLATARADANLAKDRPNLHEYLDQQYRFLRGESSKVGQGLDKALDGLWKNTTGAKVLGYQGNERGFSSLREGNNKLINAFQTSKLLVFNAKQAVVNLSQIPVLGWPAISQMARAFGSKLPMSVAAKNYSYGLGVVSVGQLAKGIEAWKGKPVDWIGMFDPETQTALRHAEEAGLFQFSEMEHIRLYGESGTRSKLRTLSEFPASLSETVIRPSTFIAAFKTARDLGVPVEQAIPMASSLTGRTMNEFDKSFRPMLYQNTGELGKQAGQMKTYIHSYLNQMQVFYKQDKMALAQSLAAQMAASGLAGLPLYNVFSNIYGMLFDRDMTNDIRDNIKDFAENKASVDEIDMMMYGPLSHYLGLNLHTSSSAADLLPSGWEGLAKSAVPSAAWITADVAPKVGQFLLNPDGNNLRTMVRSVTPASLQGVQDSIYNVEERSDGTKFLKDKDNYALNVELSNRDVNVRKYGMGFTSYDQFRQQNKSYHNVEAERTRNEKLKNGKKQLELYLMHGEYTQEGIDKRLDKLINLVQDDPELATQLVDWYTELHAKTGLSKVLPREVVPVITTDNDEAAIRAARLMKDVR